MSSIDRPVSPVVCRVLTTSTRVRGEILGQQGVEELL